MRLKFYNRTVDRLTKEFVRTLTSNLLEEEVFELRKLSAEKLAGRGQWRGEDPAHIFHDDPNQAMLEAFERVMGREMLFSSDEEIGKCTSLEWEMDAEIFNDAFTKAEERGGRV